MWINYLAGYEKNLVYREFSGLFPTLVSAITMTVGTVFLMWLGEQIDEYGIGNGISLLIMAGIICRIPDATKTLLFERGHLKGSILTLGGGSTGQDVSLEKLLVLMFLFVAVVV